MTENEVVATIYRLNCDASVHAILLQLPLDSIGEIDSYVCTNAIAVDKVSMIGLLHCLRNAGFCACVHLCMVIVLVICVLCLSSVFIDHRVCSQ